MIEVLVPDSPEEYQGGFSSRLSYLSLDELIDELEAVRKIEEVITMWKNDTNAAIMTALMAEGLTSSTNGSITVRYIPETVSAVLDSKRLKTEMPEIYGQFLKDVIKAGHIRVTKGGDQND